MNSLWGEEFNIEPEKVKVRKTVDKINKAKDKVVTTKSLKSKTIDIDTKLAFIESEVNRILGSYRENTQVIRNKEEFKKYIDASIQNGIISIDTETDNSLDPLTCKLMGPCIYTPGQKQAYIPINHIDKNTGNLLDNQLTEDDIREQFARLDNTFIIMHNGKFDIQVIQCTTGERLHIDWDTMVAARLLNENERAGLKEQYIQKIDPTQEKYDIEHLFEGVEYAKVSPELFALYAATDPYITYKLYEYQLKEFEKQENKKLYKLFTDIEMKVVPVIADMELTGVEIDTDYSKKLADKYNALLKNVDKKIEAELDSYSDQIKEWKLTKDANYKPANKKGEAGAGKSKVEQLSDPISVTSPTQLAILLYDILKVQQASKKSPRGTGEDILQKINLPICQLILEKRGLEKLLNTYVLKLPECINPKTHRLHGHFNQIGADTGRLSSSDPNLQNIPSHNKDIRLMFKAANNKVFVGGDYSQQEPRLLATYANDENMLNAYRHGKDLYATIASGVYHNNYEDNLEFKDGQLQPEGKKRRGNCKSLLLGIMYGRGVASIAEQIHGTYEEAQQILDGFYKSYPRVKKWTDTTIENARKTGYVEDLWGRRRRLDDLKLKKYEVKDEHESSYEFNPILNCVDKIDQISMVLSEKYINSLNQCKTKAEVDAVKTRALQDHIHIKDNTGFIAQAERQCVNARIQGGAATMSKRAMINVYNNKELQQLGFKLVLAIHDELIGECPKENKDRCAELLSQCMIESAKPECQCPMKCDTAVTSRWYEDDYSAEIHEKYIDLLAEGKTENEAREKIIQNNPMIQLNYLDEMIHNTYECGIHSDI